MSPSNGELGEDVTGRGSERSAGGDFTAAGQGPGEEEIAGADTGGDQKKERGSQ
ncbi:MAG: hypothetical protein QM757_28070 [Paludibaculum sp.]